MIDIVPTILEATGIKAPQQVDGIKQKPIEGVSMAYTFDAANANAPSTRKTQYFEMVGNRGIYHEGWYANTHPPVPPWELNAKFPDVNDYKWELYNLAEDYSQTDDLAAKMPDKLKQMQALFQQEAEKYGVLPLDNSQFQRAIAPRPSAVAGQDRLHLRRREPRHSGRQRAEHPEQVVHDHRRDRGPEGRRRRDDRHRGRPLRRLRRSTSSRASRSSSTTCSTSSGRAGKAAWAARDWLGESLTPGKHTIVFDFKYDGPGIAKGGTGVLKVDGKELATQKLEHTIPFLLPPDETFDVGVDTRTAVDGSYQIPFRFNGKIDKLTFKLGPTQLAAEDQKKVQEAIARARD